MALSRALVVLRSHLDPPLSSCGERTLEGTNNVDVKQEKKKEKKEKGWWREREREREERVGKESKKKEWRRKEERERKRAKKEGEFIVANGVGCDKTAELDRLLLQSASLLTISFKVFYGRIPFNSRKKPSNHLSKLV